MPDRRDGGGRPLAAELTGTGPAVVLLHGQPGLAADWQWVVPYLSARYETIVPDRPGYGRTGGPPAGFAGNARAVVDLLDGLDVDRAVVVGHSWAGGVALALALDHPDRVAGLVLVASVGPGEHIGWEDRLLAAPVAGELFALVTLGGIGLVLGSARVQNLARRRLAGRPRHAVAALAHMTRDGRVWRTFVAEQRTLLNELDSLGPGLAGIAAPTAVLHGSADRQVPPAVAETLAASIPGASLHKLAGAGHLIPHDWPYAVAEAVDEVAGQTDR